MTVIHQTAIVEDGAKLGANVSIGPYCIIGPKVVIGDGVKLHAHVVIAGRTTIGAGTEVFPFASLGHAPQDLKFTGEESELIIGMNNKIREHATMNPGTAGGGMKTVVGDNCLFMVGAHVAHDCVVGNNVIMANNATLGGHVTVGDYAVIGGLAAVHQFVRIGAYSVIGGVSAAVGDIIPYGRAKSGRAILSGLNLVGLERSGMNKEEVRTMQRAYNAIYEGDGSFEERLAQAEKTFAGNARVLEIINFARNKSKLGLCQPEQGSA